MNVEDLRNFCLSLPATIENCPWTKPGYANLITFKIGGKWYCLFDPDDRLINLKLQPEKIQELLARYSGTSPAWHMNKRHWISLKLEVDIPDAVIRQLVTDAYNLVRSSLPKSLRASLQ